VYKLHKTPFYSEAFAVVGCFARRIWLSTFREMSAPFFQVQVVREMGSIKDIVRARTGHEGPEGE
jgi:hypothetical protein